MREVINMLVGDRRIGLAVVSDSAQLGSEANLFSTTTFDLEIPSNLVIAIMMIDFRQGRI